MRKNKLLINLFSISLLTLSLCSCSKNDNRILSRRIKGIDSFIYISDQELLDLLKHKQDFILVVGEDGCSSCEYIKTPFYSYIKKYESIVYWIEYPLYQKACDKKEYNLNTNVLSSTVLIFDDGIEKIHIDYDSSIYFSKDKLDYTLSKYISPKGVYDINDYESYKYNEEVVMYKQDLETRDKLNQLIKQGKKVNILYSWKDCGDCKEFKNLFLNDFMKNHNIELYEYEVDSIRSKRKEDGSYDLDEFTVFATEMEFSSYRGGKVPTIVTYENGKKTDMIVYSNDVIEEKDNKYVVTTSFHQSLINKESNDKQTLHNELIKEEFSLIKDYLLR